MNSLQIYTCTDKTISGLPGHLMMSCMPSLYLVLRKITMYLYYFFFGHMPLCKFLIKLDEGRTECPNMVISVYNSLY